MYDVTYIKGIPLLILIKHNQIKQFGEACGKLDSPGIDFLAIVIDS